MENCSNKSSCLKIVISKFLQVLLYHWTWHYSKLLFIQIILITVWFNFCFLFVVLTINFFLLIRLDDQCNTFAFADFPGWKKLLHVQITCNIFLMVCKWQIWILEKSLDRFFHKTRNNYIVSTMFISIHFSTNNIENFYRCSMSN